MLLNQVEGEVDQNLEKKRRINHHQDKIIMRSMIEVPGKILDTEVEVETKVEKILEDIHHQIDPEDNFHQKDPDMILLIHPEVGILHTEEILLKKSLLEENPEGTPNILQVEIAPNISPANQEEASPGLNQKTEISRIIKRRGGRGAEEKCSVQECRELSFSTKTQQS